MTDIEKMISQLEQQRTVIDRALSALREIAVMSAPGSSNAPVANAAPAASTKGMSLGARKRISDAVRKHWAAKRLGAKVSAPAGSPRVPKKRSGSRKGRISEEGRQRIAEANRKRWAAKKAAEAGQKSAAALAKNPVKKS